MSKKNVMEFDFGIDFADDLNEDLAKLNNEAEKHKDKAQQMYDMIMPLLNNLKKNPDKPNIVWPNREKKIDEFIKKLDDVLNG